MKENRLISIGERNFQVESWIKENNKVEKEQDFTRSIALDWIFQYTKFCIQPLNIGMFVPAVFDGGKWVVLEEPYTKEIKYRNERDELNELYWSDYKQYQTSLDNVIFEGFEICNYKGNEFYNSVSNNDGLILNFDGFEKVQPPDPIESIIKYNPTLTKYGQQQSGL